MFYPVDCLKRGGRFYACWVADSWPLRFATITYRQLWSQDIREICDELLAVIENESGVPKYRFSLRLSSQLIRGVVRLYQKKVTVFFADLCMLNAVVMRGTHKKYKYSSDEANDEVLGQLPRIIVEDIEDEEKIEDRIRASGNVVANIEEITLKEPTLLENKSLLDDGFGELHPDQAFQALGNRTIEMMLVQENSLQQHSALDLPVDVTDKSQDKSRLVPELQMERLSEHDMSASRISVGGGQIPLDDVPKTPEIQPAPALEPQSVTKEVLQPPLREPSKEVEEEEFVLEELEHPRGRKRRQRSRLIVDKRIILTSDYLRSRIADNYVELRSTNSKYDVIAPPSWVPARILMMRAAHCGHHTRDNLGYSFATMFVNRLDHGQRQPYADLPLPSILFPPRDLPRIDEDAELMINITVGQEGAGNITDARVVSYVEKADVSVPVVGAEAAQDVQQMDISELPTQKLATVPRGAIASERKRASDAETSPSKRRRSGLTTFRMSQVERLLKHNKENIPCGSRAESILTSMLVAAGLAPARVEPGTRATRSSDSSETQLGSLDRTKVSLGESEKTTDSRKFIEEEWGTQGTMLKIYSLISARSNAPITVQYLLSKGPVVAGRERFIAARCFSSILKLKSNGLIKVIKDPDTLEIRDILLGDVITSRRR